MIHPGTLTSQLKLKGALRVLDGSILVLCAVGGVQSQTITVDRQMNRYKVPRLAFINKCDRSGADPLKVARQMREKAQPERSAHGASNRGSRQTLKVW